MSEPLHLAYIDEAGNVVPDGRSHILVVAALGMHKSPAIARIIRKAQKKAGSSQASGELKAKKEQSGRIEKLLAALAKQPIEIYAVIIDQQVLVHLPQDPEDVYRWAVARLAAKIVRRYPAVELILDRRYTKERLRYLLEKSIREQMMSLPQRYVMVRQQDSIACKELQAVDFIAWALFQKYERGDSRFYDRIAARVVEEELVTRSVWEQSRA
jgi:hypothetical protein